MKPESAIKHQIRLMLQNEFDAYYFAPVQMGMGASTVDILACIKGKFCAIEVKVPGKRPTVRQNITISQVLHAGGVAFWTDSVEDAYAQLKAAGL